MRSPQRSFRVVLLFLLVAVFACATGQSTPRAEPSTDIPVVQIQNDSQSKATIYLEGSRLTTVERNKTVVYEIPAFRIPASRQVHFTAVAQDRKILLPVVEYQKGRKMQILLRPSSSTAF